MRSCFFMKGLPAGVSVTFFLSANTEGGQALGSTALAPLFTALGSSIPSSVVLVDVNGEISGYYDGFIDVRIGGSGSPADAAYNGGQPLWVPRQGPAAPGVAALGIGLSISNGVVDGTIDVVRPVLHTMTISGGRLIADAVGSVVVDIRKGTLANPLPTLTGADSICGGSPPTLTGHQYVQLDVTAWAKTLAAGEFLQFVISGSSGIAALTLALEVEA